MLALVVFIFWLSVLMILHKHHMHFFKFTIGSIGLFCFLMYVGRSSVEHYLEYAVTWSMWLIGMITGIYKAYPDYSMITIYKGHQAVSFFVDYECSGFVESLVYICLLLFYPVYKAVEKIKYTILGFAYILFSNVLRVFTICLITRIWGSSFFFFSHTVFARLLFFGFMLVLYYYVFTRPHIIRQKVGNLTYDSK